MDSKSVLERRVYGARVPLAAAGPMSLLVVGVASATALLPRLRQGQVAWRIAGVFGAAGAAAAFAGAAVNRLLDPRVLLIGFAALMIAAGIRMLGEQAPLGGNCALRGCLPKAIGSGLAVGFLTGLFGVGGGFLIIPALTSLTIADLHLGDGPHVRCHGKGRKERATPLTRQTVAVLRAWMRERSGATTDPVLPTRQGHPLSVDAIQWLLAKHTRAAADGCSANAAWVNTAAPPTADPTARRASGGRTRPSHDPSARRGQARSRAGAHRSSCAG